MRQKQAIIGKLRRRLYDLDGVERDRYAAAWWSSAHQEQKEKLRRWARQKAGGGGRGVAVERRPELKGWIDTVFGEDWGRIKRMSLPPTQPARASGGKAARPRYYRSKG